MDHFLINKALRRRVSSAFLAVTFLLTMLVIPVGADVTTDDSGMKVTLSYQPGSIVMDSDGSIYVGDWSNGNLYKYKPDGTLDTSWGNAGNAKWSSAKAGGTCGMCFTHDGNILITGQNSGTVFLIEKSTGNILKTVSVTHPLGVAADAEGNIYVAYQSGIVKYDGNLNLITTKVLGNMVYGVAVDPEGRVYYDTFQSSIYRLNSNLTADTTFGTGGSVMAFNAYAGGLYYCDGSLYGSSEYDYKVKKIDTSGTNVDTIIQGTGPNNIFITGDYYVVPFWGGRYFQIFKRPKINVAAENFQASLDVTSLSAGSMQSLHLTITSDSVHNYGVTAKVYNKATGVLLTGATASTATLSNGDATITINAPYGGWQAGEYSFQVIFTTQEGGISLSDSLEISPTIQVGSPSLTLSADPQAGSVGQSATLTAAVTNADDGTVTFKANGAVIGSTAISGGRAVCTYTPSATGSFSLTAEYSKNGSIYTSNTLTYTVGKGTQTTFSIGSVPASLSYGGVPFTVTTSGKKGSGAVSFSSSNPDVLSVNPGTGEVTIVGAGKAKIIATIAADGNYNEASVETPEITVNKANQLGVAFGSTPAATMTYGDAPFSAAITGAQSAGGVTYTSSDPNVLSVDPDTGEVTIVGAGTAKIVVTVAADDNYNEASIETPEITVNKADQSGVAFGSTPAATMTYGDAPFSAAITGVQSTGGVTYASSDPNVLSVDSDTGEVTIVGAGTAKIVATAAADSNYNEASIETPGITVNKADQSGVAFGSTPATTMTYGDSPFSAAITGAQSTGGVTYASSDPDVLSVDSDTGEVTIVGAGKAKIIATAAADSNYNEASIETPEITVNKADQSGVAFGSTPAATMMYGDSPFSAAITGAQSTGGVTYTSSDPDVLSVDSDTGEVTIVGAGKAKIIATAAADSNYNEASIETPEITISKADQSGVAFENTSSTTMTYGDAPFSVAIIGVLSTGGVTYTSSDPTVLSVDPVTGEVTIVGTGTAKITATVAADGNYNGVSLDTLDITVNKADQLDIAFGSTPAATMTYGDAPFSAAITGAQSTGGVTYASSDPDVLSVDPGTGEVTIVGAGKAKIIATVAADGNYNEASVETPEITVNKANQLGVAFGSTPAATMTYGDAPFSAAITGVQSTGGVTYASSDPDVLSVDPGTGEVTIVGAGKAKIIATVAADGNYNEASIETPEITVNKADQSGFAFEKTPAATITYGDGAFSAAAVGGQSIGDVTYTSSDPNVLSVDPATGEVTIVGAGTAKLTAAKAGDGRYNDIIVSTDLITVRKAVLTATAQDASMDYGQTPPDFAVSVTGFVNGDTPDALAGYVAPTANCSDTSVGTHAIAVSGGDATDNYEFSYVGSTFTVREVTASPEDYTVTGSTAGWNTSDVVIVPTGSYTKIWDGTAWADKLVVTEGSPNPVTFMLKKDDGTQTDVVSLGNIQVDTTAPAVQSVLLNVAPAAEASQNSISYNQYFKDVVTLEIHAQDATSGVKAVEYQFVPKDGAPDGGAWVVYSADHKPTQAPGFTGYIAVRTTDAAGNVSVSCFGGFTVDDTAPVISGIADNGSYYIGRQIGVTDGSGDALAGTYTRDGGAETPFENGDVLTDSGSYVIKVSDKSGNSSTVHIVIKPLPDVSGLDASDASEALVSSIRDEYNQAQSYLPEPYKSDIDNRITALENRIKELRVKIVENAETGASVEGVGDTDFDASTVLVVENVTDSLPSDTVQSYNANIRMVSSDKELVQLYDMKLLLNGQPIQPDGKVKIRIKLTEEMKKYSDLQVVYIDDNGNTEVMDSELDGDYIVFYTTHFSHYGVIGTPAQSNPKTGGTHSAAAASALVLLAMLTIGFFRKKPER